MNITWTLHWIAIMLYIQLFSRVLWFLICLFIQNWIFIISNMSLNRLLWNRIIRNKISQYWINFDWLFFFRVQYNHNHLKLFYELIVKNVDVQFNSNIFIFINSHEILLLFFFLSVKSASNNFDNFVFFVQQFTIVTNSTCQKIMKTCQSLFYSNVIWFKLSSLKIMMFQIIFFRRCFLMKTIKVKVKLICVNNWTSFFTEHQLLTFKI